MGGFSFPSLSLAIVVSSLVARNLSLARQRLERRVTELDSLQTVGRALSASLDLETILQAIHTEVSRLMPAQNFYAALYDSDSDEVAFPLAFEEGLRRHWRSRQAGTGLTEYLVRTRRPLLIERDVACTLDRLGIDQIGTPAESWLGVPMIAGDEPLGVIAVQSFSSQQRYDISHQEILTTIASQAAVAIQNARLYLRTDEALARRVRELDSILRTTREGILLIDLSHKILEANRALANLVGVARGDLAGQDILAPISDGERSWVECIGYSPEKLAADKQILAEKTRDVVRELITLGHAEKRQIERTLASVHDREGATTGWLLAFRDVTEEQELARLRNDLADMLVHDLRSPLSMVASSLELARADLDDGNAAHVDHILSLAQKSVHHLLTMINDLLDISRLESGMLPLYIQPVDTGLLLKAVTTRLTPPAQAAGLALDVSIEPNLPLLCVDLSLIDRVIHNLVDNALKFTPEGGRIELSATCDPSDQTENVLIRVSDTGPGIPPEVHARLFQKFQQVSAISGRRPGSGLGLLFCRLAVEAHGGTIQIESWPGQGSTFLVRLPHCDSKL